ncbi:MAG: hypothetical protein WBP81_26965 [Solirubrobacteraceae bacterium]
MTARTGDDGAAYAGSQLQTQLYVNRRAGELDDAIRPRFPISRTRPLSGGARSLKTAPRSHLREHFEREIALLDAMPVRRAVYVGAPDVVAGHELE